MNFEERKAEIFRRGNARIAAKKRKKRIVLGAVVPVLLVALLAFPVDRLLGSAKGEEKATAIQMENQPSIAPGEQPAPQATYPELQPDDNLLSPILRDNPQETGLETLYLTPPNIYVYSPEGTRIQAMDVGYWWEVEFLGSTTGVVAESPDIFSPGVVEVRIDTCYGFLIVDVSNYMPAKVDSLYWSIDTIGKGSDADRKSNSASLSFGKDMEQYIPNHDFNLSKNLYRLDLAPGENLYRINIQWPNGYATYSFRANYKE